MEIWNLVFMQFNRDASGEMTPLPKPSIDTGGGLERWAAVLQGVRSSWESDAFTPLIDRAGELSGVTPGEDAEKDVSLRVVADHARALAFLIGDGVLPSNAGRGYVLRRILRRGSRHGVLLGQEQPFIHSVADAVIDQMSEGLSRAGRATRLHHGSNPARRGALPRDPLQGTRPARGRDRELKARGESRLPGESVFKLYDTFGFPVDLTADILVGHDMTLDQSGFDQAMGEQKKRARAAWKGSGDTAVQEIYGRIAADLQTSFRGYETLELEAPIAALIKGGEAVSEAEAGDEVELIFEETPFYGESGGQVGDRGRVTTDAAAVEIRDVQKPVDGLFVHLGKVVDGRIAVDDEARLVVDSESRQATIRNHTGTHLLHAALREVLGEQAMQKGSLVGPERLRFDFTHDSPLREEELEAIEDRVNEWIESNQTGATREMDYKSALEAGAVAIFDEKYGDRVRGRLLRRLQHRALRRHPRPGHGRYRPAQDRLRVRDRRRHPSHRGPDRPRRPPPYSRPGAPRERGRATAQGAAGGASGAGRAAARGAQGRTEADRRSAGAQAGRGLGRPLRLGAGARGGGSPAPGRSRVGSRDVDAKAMRTMVDDLRNRLGTGVVCLAAAAGEKALLAIGVTKDLTDRLKAGDLIREVAGVVGGGGGGKFHLELSMPNSTRWPQRVGAPLNRET